MIQMTPDTLLEAFAEVMEAVTQDVDLDEVGCIEAELGCTTKRAREIVDLFNQVHYGFVVERSRLDPFTTYRAYGCARDGSVAADVSCMTPWDAKIALRESVPVVWVDDPENHPYTSKACRGALSKLGPPETAS